MVLEVLGLLKRTKRSKIILDPSKLLLGAWQPARMLRFWAMEAAVLAMVKHPGVFASIS